MVLIDSRVFIDFVSFSRGSSSTGWTSSDKSWRWISWRATNATANAVAGDRTSTLDAAIERELRLVLVGGVKQVPAYCRRGAAEMAATSTCLCLVFQHMWWRDLYCGIKKDNTFGQPDPVTKFGKKGQDGLSKTVVLFSVIQK